MHLVRIVGLCFISLIAHAMVVAAEPWDADGVLDICLAAALQERPGIVTGWRQVGGGEQPPYEVSILNRDGKIGQATCEPANPVNFQFKEKSGIYRYAMYERATLPEANARVSAPDIFAGPVRFMAMELSAGFTGKPYYTYQLFLPSNHKAVVEIDATVGRLIKAAIK